MRLLTAAAVALLGTGPVSVPENAYAHQVHTFQAPIDALSLHIPAGKSGFAVSAKLASGWSTWEPLGIEDESDPLLRESNLVIFPEPVRSVRIRGGAAEYALHPIRVSKDPIRYEVAARGSTGVPRILSRAQWGADESFGVAGPVVARSDEPSQPAESTSTEVPQRVTDCEAAQQDHPGEFTTDRTVTEDGDGNEYRWPRRYSPEVRQLVVHHTAQAVSGDARPGRERMRALYEFHANSRGWGDIGYHYVIDDEGQIYEGRAGGEYVVGGHVYCGNVGTIGVALMGNFDTEKPTDAQMRSLQWLLAHLAGVYDLNLETSATFHGETFPAIVGHGDLIATECPGYYVRETLGIIRRHVIAGDFGAAVPFPSLVKRSDTDATSAKKGAGGLRAIGSTALTGRPGGLLHISLQYTADRTVPRRGRIATVKRSNSTIGLWQERDGHYADVRAELVAPEEIPGGGSSTLRLRMQLPKTAGTYTVDIGSVTYVLTAAGRRASGPKAAPTHQSFSAEERTNVQTPGYRRVRASESATELRAGTRPAEGATIRIRLSFTGTDAEVESASPFSINGQPVSGHSVSLRQDAHSCVASADGKKIASGTVRLNADNGIQTILTWEKPENRFRGTLECRVIHGEMVLINELPLEDYMAGLAEEPDSEPWEKQRAFAIAARSYAAHYLDPERRKFPGMPYDGSDTGASFQKYGGYAFERANPQWVRAVRDTAGLVLTKRRSIVKAAYFSTSDGRTRSPEEKGWNDFPFAEVFRSKPDPWCAGEPLHGHGVGMSGCGAEGQAEEGKTAEDILQYYYPGTSLLPLE